MNTMSICGTGSLVDSLNMNNVSNHVLSLTTMPSTASSSLLSNTTDSPSSSYSSSMTNTNNVNNNVTNSNINTSLEESKTNLIINYLPQAMTQEDLRNLFGSIGELESCKLIRDKLTGQSLGYGFVNYVNAADAEKAINTLNALRMQQKTIKVSFARPSTPLIKDANLYVSGLPKSMTQEDLQRIFQPYGRIITSRILVDPSTGMSRGVGFVRYDKRPEAENAISNLNGTVPSGAKDPITVKFANNPSQKNQQVLQSLYAATSPTRRLTASAGSALYHQARNLRAGVNDLLSNVNMGLGMKRARPYPELRAASIITAGGLQAPTQALQLATSAEYAISATPYLTANLAPVEPFSALPSVAAYPGGMQIQPLPAGGAFAALPRPIGTSYAQFLPGASSELSAAGIGGLTPLAALPMPTGTSRSTVPVTPTTSSSTAAVGVLATIAGPSISSTGVINEVASSVCDTSTAAQGSTEASSAQGASWYSPLTSELLTSMAVPGAAASAASSSVIGQPQGLGFCIFVYNLAPETDESILWQLFGPFGAVTSVKVIRDFQTQKCKGYAFVTMTNYEEALPAVLNLNGHKLGDRVLQVSFKTTRQVKFMH